LFCPSVLANVAEPMGTVYNAKAPGRLLASTSSSKISQALPRTNSVTASQARAARRREARRDEQAVAAWLRELAGRTR
jgi:hypothetical protein